MSRPKAALEFVAGTRSIMAIINKAKIRGIKADTRMLVKKGLWILQNHVLVLPQ